jgi:hypothetical protein
MRSGRTYENGLWLWLRSRPSAKVEMIVAHIRRAMALDWTSICAIAAMNELPSTLLRPLVKIMNEYVGNHNELKAVASLANRDVRSLFFITMSHAPRCPRPYPRILRGANDVELCFHYDIGMECRHWIAMSDYVLCDFVRGGPLPLGRIDGHDFVLTKEMIDNARYHLRSVILCHVQKLNWLNSVYAHRDAAGLDLEPRDSDSY